MLTLPTDYFSPTQDGMYRRCGEQYRQRYVEGIKVPPAGSMLMGGGVHSGAAARNLERMNHDTEMPRRDVIDFAVSAYDERLDDEGIELRGDEATRGRNAVVGDYRDQTATLAGGFSELVAPQIMHPVAVEEKIELDVEKLGIKFVGILDVAQESNRVVMLEDLKCGSKLHGQDAVDGSDQLTFYAMAWQQTRGRLPDAVGLRSLRDLARGPKQTLVIGHRTDDHIVKLLRIISTTVRAISAGSFVPAPPGAWWCSEKWCGYWNRCRYRGGK
jgi:hypothetical protein